MTDRPSPVDRRAAAHLDAVLAAADRHDYPAPVSVYIDEGDRITLQLETAAGLRRWCDHGEALYRIDVEGRPLVGAVVDIDGVTVFLRAPGMVAVS